MADDKKNRIYLVKPEDYDYFGREEFTSKIQGGKTPGAVIGTLVNRLRHDRALILKLLAPAEHESTLDESMVFAQQIFYLLSRDAWYEALDLAAVAQRRCDLTQAPFTSACIKFGIAYGLISAAAAIELEALGTGKHGHLKYADEACLQAIRHLDELAAERDHQVLAALKLRVRWGLACAYALQARVMVERWLSEKNPEMLTLEGETELDRFRAFETAWENGLGDQAKQLMVAASSTEVATEVSRTAERAVEHLQSIQPLSKFLGSYAKTDSDLLYVRCTQPFSDYLSKEFWGGEFHYRDFILAMKSLNLPLSSAPPSDGGLDQTS